MTGLSSHQGTTEKRLAALRARIHRIEAGGAGEDGLETFVPIGLGDIDRHLPGGGLARGAVHEILAGDGGGASGAAALSAAHSMKGGSAAAALGAANSMKGGSAALGFALTVIARMTGSRPWLWCARGASGDDDPRGTMPYVPALTDFGLKPKRLLLARTAFERETLWAAEEGLATPALGAVLAEAGSVSPIAARRLALAARASGVPLILLRAAAEASSGPAATRWRVSAAPHDTWEIALLRAGGSFPRRWRVAWRGAEGLRPIPVNNEAMDRTDDGWNEGNAAGARPVAAASVRGAA